MIRSRIISSFFISTIILLQQSCVNDPAKVKSFAQNLSLPVQTAHNMDLLYTDSARLKVHLTATEVNEYVGPKPYTEMTKGVRVEFYTDSGKVETWLTADYAIRREREDIMEAKKNVVVVNSKGERLNTESLTWDGTTRKIYTKSFVKITTNDQVLMGKGMESDEMFNHYEIKEPTGNFNLKDDPDNNN